jgi:ABC-2 type transport system permease protein
MTDALRYEWVRLRTLRSTWWLIGLAFAPAMLLELHALTLKGDVTVVDYGDILTAGGLGAFLVAILLSMIGIFAIGHEYRYGTIRPTLTALPQRSTVMAAKVLVVLAVVLVVSLLIEIGQYLVALSILGHRLLDLGLFPGPMARVWIGLAIYNGIFALVGLALAGLFRNIPSAIVTVILFPLLIENLIRGLLTISALEPIRGLGKVLPFSAGEQIFSYQPVPSDAPSGFTEVPSPGIGLLVFLVFLILVLGLAWALFEKRDA